MYNQYNNDELSAVTGRIHDNIYYIITTIFEIQESSADFSDFIKLDINNFKNYVHINNLKMTYLHAILNFIFKHIFFKLRESKM